MMNTVNGLFTINKKEAASRMKMRLKLSNITFDSNIFVGNITVGNNTIDIFCDPDYVNCRGYIGGCISVTPDHAMIVVDDVYRMMPENIKQAFIQMLSGYSLSFKYGKVCEYGMPSDRSTIRSMHSINHNMKEVTFNADRCTNPKAAYNVLKWFYHYTQCPKAYLKHRAQLIKMYATTLKCTPGMLNISNNAECKATIELHY